MTSGDKDKKGFGAFDDLVSDISKEIEIQAQGKSAVGESTETTKPRNQDKSPPPPQSQEPQPEAIPHSTPGSGGEAGVWVAIAVFVILFIIAFSDENKVEALSQPVSDFQEPYTSPQPEVSIPAESLAENQAPEPRDPINPEEIPPVGQGHILSANQIRYCLSMQTRLETIQESLNNNSQLEVGNYNSFVQDYNSRCVNFRYIEGLLEHVKSQVNLNRPTLVTEGLKILETWREKDSHPRKSEGLPHNGPVSDSSVPEASKGTPTLNRDSYSQRLSDDAQGSIDSVCSGEKLLYGTAAYKKCLADQKESLTNAAAPDLSRLTSDEQSSIEAVCKVEKSLYGPAAYYKCLDAQKKSLTNAAAPDLSRLTSDEQSSIESVCKVEKSLYGPAAYYKCLANQKESLTNSAPPDLSLFTSDEQRSIESVCKVEKSLYGPAAYYKCLAAQKKSLSNAATPDLSRLTLDEQRSIESVCKVEKSLYGPAAYYKCLQSQVRQLQ